jgi:hypothetical protein
MNITTGSTREQKLFDALRRIAAYDSPSKLRKSAESEYGLSYTEALEMAYENIIQEAKSATKGMRRPLQ